MFWVVNTALKREGGYDALIYNLDRQNIEYELVRKPPFADYLVNMTDDEPMELFIDGPVFVTGTTSMKLVSDKMKWSPGYIDSPGICECYNHWGDHMLNADAKFGSIDMIEPIADQFFIRPDLDTKSFAGTVLHAEDFIAWREDLMDIKGYTTIPKWTIVIMSSLKTIWAEYRCIMVNGKYVTGSRYKTGKTVAYSSDVGQRIIDYANARAKEWTPRCAFTLDIADTPDGLKVIETNAVSSSGFYAIDMGIFVDSISNMDYT